MTVAIVGAGWSGAVIARQLAEAGHTSVVFEKRQHVAGNCHTERRRDVLVHAYGPHIFHTDDEQVWDWVQQWADWRPYRLTVRATSRGQVFTLPVNLHTLNQVYQKAWTPRQARHALAENVEGASQPHPTRSFMQEMNPAVARTECGTGPSVEGNPTTFEQAAIGAVSEPVYRRLFQGYTTKQWGVAPSELPADVFHRLPVRFNYDDRYFTHKHEAMPADGYTEVIKRILDHPLIEVRRSTWFDPGDASRWQHVFWSGPLDAWFSYGLGRLGYRTLKFKWDIQDGDQQGVALMNWPDLEIPFTRVTEHNHLSPWESHDVSVRSYEYPAAAGPDDEPFYPLRLANDRRLLDRYVQLAGNSQRVSFVGRLGTYRYLDMDRTIREALDTVDRYLLGDVRPFYVDI